MSKLALLAPRAGLALAVGLAAGCARSTSSPPAPAPAPVAVVVEVSGCAALSREGVCTVPDDGVIRVLVGTTSEASFGGADGGTDGGIRAAALATFDDARLYEVHVAPEARRVHVLTQLTVDGHAVSAEADVAVRIGERPAWLAEARGYAEHGELEEALAVYREHVLAPDEDEAALAFGHAARIELALGHVDESVSLFRDAIDRDRAVGRVSDAVDDSMALVFALNQRSRRYVEARAVLDGLADLLPLYPDGRAREPYYRSQLVSEAGDRRDALRRLREAERRASRLGLTRLLRMVRSSMATELDLLGRFDDALALRRAQDRELAGAPAACDRVLVRSGMGFGLLMLATRAGGDLRLVKEATEVLEQARREAGCEDSYLRAATLGNLAVAALLAGRPDEAAARLAAARARVEELPLGESFAWLELDARIALARRNAGRAVALYDELAQRARAALLVEWEWTAFAGRGAALEALGRKGDALDAYARAEAKLDDASLAIPVGEGRAGFLVERERSSTAAIRLLVASGRTEEAFRWARRARRRLLAGVEATRRIEGLQETGRARWDEAIDRYARERAAIDEEASGDWKLLVGELRPAQERRQAREAALRSALEELLSVLAGEGGAASPEASPPAEGELVLLFHPAEHGWTGFAVDARTTSVFQVAALEPSASPDELARRLLVPARAQIDRSARVRLLLPGGLAHVDVHALPYEGEPLVARLPVEYGLDLAGAPAPVSGELRAVVVGDPQRDLPGAKGEADGVAAALAGRGGAVDLLEAGRATHAAVVDALGAASLFHYAGHATYQGKDGWDSMLPLAAGGHLVVSDVLALRHAPARVVLSGCSAARTSSASPGDTLGMAQAFLVAGSDVVVAPTRDVADAVSAQFVANLYDALRGDASADVARAARAAQLKLRENEPAGDWANFRVLRR